MLHSTPAQGHRSRALSTLQPAVRAAVSTVAVVAGFFALHAPSLIVGAC